MKLTNENDKVLFYTHWLRLVQPVDIAQVSDLTLDYLFRRMPEMAEEGYLHKVQWPRQRIEDPYAAYELGPDARLVLRDAFGIPLNKTRFKRTPKLDNTRWISHTLLTTKIVVPMWEMLGELFTPQYVTDFKTDVVHNGQRKRLTITPDYSFTITIGNRARLHHIEADNAGKDDDGTIYKGEPLTRKEIEQQSLYRKLLGYLAGLKYGRLKYRVLIVTRSHARANNLHEQVYPLLLGKGGEEYKDYVLVNYLKSVQNDPLGSWTNFAGEHASLLPEG